jgi:hypothetical protein
LGFRSEVEMDGDVVLSLSLSLWCLAFLAELRVFYLRLPIFLISSFKFYFRFRVLHVSAVQTLDVTCIFLGLSCISNLLKSPQSIATGFTLLFTVIK